MRYFTILVLGVIEQRTVSLVWLAQNSASATKSMSVYHRFQRFFAFCVLTPKSIGVLILPLAPKPKDGWILAIDREFISEKWLSWLQLVGLRYVVRVKKIV